MGNACTPIGFHPIACGYLHDQAREQWLRLSPNLLTCTACLKVRALLLLISRISVTFRDEKDLSVKTVQVPLGQNLLEAAHANDIDLEGDEAARLWRSINTHVSVL